MTAPLAATLRQLGADLEAGVQPVATAVEWQWLTTAADPHYRGTSADCGQRGWRLHAVAAAPSETFGEVRDRVAACGLKPSHGWGLDMFIDRPCARCLRATGAVCATCRGTRRERDGTPYGRFCRTCNGTGTREGQTAIVLRTGR